MNVISIVIEFFVDVWLYVTDKDYTPFNIDNDWGNDDENTSMR